MPLSPPSWNHTTVVLRPAPAMRRQSRASNPSLPWRPDRVQRKRPVARAVVSDRGDRGRPGRGAGAGGCRRLRGSSARAWIEPNVAGCEPGSIAVPGLAESPPKAVSARVTRRAPPTTASSTRRRARSCARRWRARSRAACRERGVAIMPKVPHRSLDHRPRRVRSSPCQVRRQRFACRAGSSSSASRCSCSSCSCSRRRSGTSCSCSSRRP